MKVLRLLFAAKTSIVRVVPLMRDTRVPLSLKAIAIGLGVLTVSPVDIFSDIPVLGMFDDVAMLTMICMAFVYLAGRHVAPVPVRPVRRRPGDSLAIR